MATTPSGYIYPASSYASGWRQAVEDLADSAEDVILEAGTPRFADAAARDAAIPSPVLGMKAVLTSNEVVYRYNGTTWAIWEQAPSSGTFTTSSAVSIQSVFLPTSQYRVIFRITAASGASTVTARLMSGGSANSAAAYTRQAIISINATNTASQSLNGTSWLTAAGTGRPLRRITIDLDQVADAQPTAGSMLATERDSGITDFGHLSYGLYHSASTAFDGIQFTPSTGTITGTWEVLRLG